MNPNFLNLAENVKTRVHSRQGTSFVEVLLSTLILLIVIVGVITLFGKSSVMTNVIREHAIVNSALNERMEEIKGMSYDDILDLSSTFTTAGFDQLKNAAGTLALTDSMSDSDIRKVTLTISWTSSAGRSESRSLVAYVTNQGINKQ